MNNLLLKLIENNELVHASIHTELKILKPINYDYLFATDNLGFAITMAFRMIFPINSIRILKFCVLGKHYIFTSFRDNGSFYSVSYLLNLECSFYCHLSLNF